MAIVDFLCLLTRGAVSGIEGVFTIHEFLCFVHEFRHGFQRFFGQRKEEVSLLKACHKISQGYLFVQSINLQGFFVESCDISPQCLPLGMSYVDEMSGWVPPVLFSNEMVYESST